MDSTVDNQQQSAKELIEVAIQLKRQGSIKKAINLAQQAIELNPDYYKSYYHLGTFLISDRNFNSAEQAFNDALKLNPNFSWSYHGLSQIFYLQNKLDAAIESSKKAIALKPDVKGYYRHLGIVLNQKGNLDEAAEVYQKAIAIDSKFAIARFELGNVLRQQQKLDRALVQYQTASELGYNSHELYGGLGSIYLFKKDWQSAAEFCRKAIKLKGNFPWYYYDLGYSLHQQGKVKQAVSNYAKALQIDPGFAPAYHQLMFSKLEPQQLNEVVAAFKYNIQQQPNASWLYTRLGDLLSKQGQLPEAIEAYKNATYKLNLWQKPEYTQKYWQKGQLQGPNFIIIGAMKAGTTSLYEYINQHPQALPCAQKEVHFFVHHLEKGLDWYLSHFPPISSDAKFVTGEASPGYLCNTVQQEVKASFPQIKLIAVLRNPVERAISHYYHNVKHGIEKRSFEAAMNDEIEAIALLPDINLVKETKNWSQQQGYLFTGLYVYFLQKWLSVFDRQQLLVIKSEDLYQKSQATMKNVFDFLELPAFTSDKYTNHLPGSYKKLDSNDPKYQLIADVFQVHNRRLSDYLQQPFTWL